MTSTLKQRQRVAFYVRVSTQDQTTDNQRRELNDVAARADWDVVGEYVDHGVSGAKGREGRAGLRRLLEDAVRRKFDKVAVWSVDRLGRSLQDLVATLDELQAAGVDLYLHQQAMDTATPAGRAMFSMCGVFAEFERSLIRERVKAGLARAKARGKVGGRPKVGRGVEEKVAELLAQGVGKRKVGETLGVGVSVVQRVARSYAL